MSKPLSETLLRDFISGLVVFLVALPLCLGISLASNAPPIAGLIAGIVGGLVVGLISKSHTSVSGPAAGLTAVVAMQIGKLGSFEAFLLAVVVAGIIQIGFGVFRLGFLSGFFPNCVIKGLLAAIGLILILKQIPHLLGHDTDAEGEMAFEQPDGKTTFSELIETAFDIDASATIIGILSLIFLLSWDRVKVLKKSLLPSALVVVVLGVIAEYLFRQIGGTWILTDKHLVNVPPINFKNWATAMTIFKFPDWSMWLNVGVYSAAITLAIVASLETLLNVEAVDKLDPQKRITPTNRELIAQGCGNITCGLIGGFPLTMDIVRSSVNINTHGQTRLSAIIHGLFTAIGIVALAPWLNRIPLSCLAAILIATGLKLFNWTLIQSIWRNGWTQFLPFIVTVAAIYRTDLLIGILIGLGVSIAFILMSNLRRPLSRVVEKHVGGEVQHIHLANQVSFLNRGMLNKTFESFQEGQHILIDARDTDYIDPDILDMINDFEKEIAPARNIKVSLLGFKQHYEQVEDKILYADFTSRELRDQLTPQSVLQILKDGNERFVNGTRISRDLNRQMAATAGGQFPMAAVLSCIDSRAPVELLFDVGLGDIFTARIAGNVCKDKVLGSLEFAAVVAGVKLIVVMGHTSCGAVAAAVEFSAKNTTALAETGCDHLDSLLTEIKESIEPSENSKILAMSPSEKKTFINQIAHRHVNRMIARIKTQSTSLQKKINDGSVQVVGCIYDISTGTVNFG